MFNDRRKVIRVSDYCTPEPELNINEKEAILRLVSKRDQEHFNTLCRMLFEQGVY